MIRLVTLTVIFMLLAISGTGCTNPAGAEFPDRPSRVNIDIALQQAAAMRARGKLDDAIISLEEAVYWGSADALKQLERYADAGHELAIEVVSGYYSVRGNQAKSMEYYYRLAKIDPGSHAFTVGVYYIFDAGEYHGFEEDRRRGRECFELAGKAGEEFTYLLLLDLASDSLIEAPSPEERILWRERAEKADELQISLLAGHLSGWDVESFTVYPEHLRRYQDKWKAEVRRLNPAEYRRFFEQADLTMSTTSCTGPPEQQLAERSSRANIDIDLELGHAAFLREKGRLNEAVRTLEEAAYFGSDDAVKQLQRDADAGHELATEVLTEYYFKQGNSTRSMEYYYRLAKINPTDHGRIVGLLYVFNSGQYHGLEEDRRRGRECLELAAPTRGGETAPAIYALLVDLASDGLIEQPSEDKLSEWEKEAAPMDRFNCLYLAAMLQLGELSTTSYPKHLRRYQDKWKAEATQLDPAKCRSTVVDGNKGAED